MLPQSETLEEQEWPPRISFSVSEGLEQDSQLWVGHCYCGHSVVSMDLRLPASLFPVDGIDLKAA